MVPSTSSPVMTTQSPVRHSCGPSAKRPRRIFGSLQVGQDRHGPPGGLRRLAYQVVDLLVVGVAAVAEVQPRHVHPGLHQAADALRRRGGRSESTDDLRAPSHPLRLVSPAHPWDGRPLERLPNTTGGGHGAACARPAAPPRRTRSGNHSGAVRRGRTAELPRARNPRYLLTMTTHEPEITEPVDLCLPDGRLNPAAVGWTRRPLHRANLRGLGAEQALGVLGRGHRPAHHRRRRLVAGLRRPAERLRAGPRHRRRAGPRRGSPRSPGARSCRRPAGPARSRPPAAASPSTSTSAPTAAGSGRPPPGSRWS